jgi:molybdopterin converting factor small subunit
VLADLVGGRRSLVVTPAPSTVGELLDRVEADEPAVVRRIRDETGALRRFVNVYVDGDDVRHRDGLDTPLAAGSTVHVLPSVAGG